MREEDTTRPSSRAVQRLASDVGGEVSDLRTALRRALEEADRHEADGRPDLAAAVLAEQQEMLAAVHRRLQDRLAGAAVEREAEGVVAAAGRAPASDGGGPVGAAAAAPSRGDGDGMGLRLLASAAAATVGMLLLLVPEAGGMLTVAGWSSVEEGPAVDAGRADDHGDRAQDEPPTTSAPGEHQAVAPTRMVLHDLAIPEASDLRPRPVSEETAAGSASDRTGRSPADPVDDPVAQVLDEVEDLTSTGADVGAATEQATDGSEDGDDQRESDAEDSPPADADEEDSGTEGSSEPRDASGEDESSGGDGGTDDGASSSTGLTSGEDTNTESSDDGNNDTDGDASDDQDGQQPEGSSSSSGLGDLATVDGESAGAER